MKNLSNIPLHLNSKFILLLAMIYVVVSVAADVVAYKYTRFFGLVESGATIIFPITYIIGDVITEVYGWNVAMKIIWYGLFCEAIFGACVWGVIQIPSFGIGEFQTEYNDILGNIWLFIMAGIIANIICGLLNVYLISKYKVLWEGKVFWIRSIISTCISEIILIFITVLIAFTPVIHLKETLHVFWNAYVLEIFYAIIFAFPAQCFVKILKLSEGIDAYDRGISYNPFKFFQQ
jgi:queuosine precursor transporter